MNVLELDINGSVFSDKVYGCWLGKNAGGTLGTPLEKAFGEPEPFDVWWYPELREGGLPNDDLEIQLGWLKAIEEVGPELTARDLARYWLDHVGYNFDEYGLSKTNLRLGLEPPVSGNYNNWFKDCMGCPIRSEIWACIAPAAPRIAARYAYQDAICDHAGGESVYGELFNVAVESAAFVIDDRRRLVDVGLSYVPDDSRTAAAIHAVLTAHSEGLDWRSARKRVLETTPHYNAQYSPINLGFQVIGLLYGEDFGAGVCKTVNCGYDTDSSGASIGSYLGILAGRSGLPSKWIEPLGDAIATNESWGGVRHLSDGTNPIPTTLQELVKRIQRIAHAVLTAHGQVDNDGVVRLNEADLYADSDVLALRDSSPTRVDYPGPDVQIGVEYLDTPAVASGTRKSIVTRLENVRPDPIVATCSIGVPSGWQPPAPQQVELSAHGTASLAWEIEVPGHRLLDNSNRLYVAVAPVERPAQPAVPLVLVGAAAIRVSGPYDRDGRTDAELLDTVLPPEERDGDLLSPTGRRGHWRELSAYDNALPLADEFERPGVLYVQTFFHAPQDGESRLAVDANCPVTFWVNAEQITSAERYSGIRPNYGGRADSAGAVSLRAGYNELLVKLVRNTAAAPVECHVTTASNDKFRAGQPHLGRTRFPWH
ncbi:ADP-ribosylglycohydrolase family protein [Actinopolymorpha sp. B17G11]|uniref:ADP-ribosylglycohydrolase family protein n=1 Tax=Actinopolymorpha sp. B17G11 TaxID=3160861 RepID=UPI0032E4037E